MKTIILLILISVMVQAQTTYDVGQTNANISSALSQALAQSDTNTVYRNAINTKFSIADSNGVNGWYKRAHLDALLAAKFNASDTASLSNRINLKLNATDTLSLSNRINLKLNISDTTNLRTFSNLKYAATSHTHSIANVTNLQDSLNKFLEESDSTGTNGYATQDDIARLVTGAGTDSGTVIALIHDVLDSLNETNGYYVSSVANYSATGAPMTINPADSGDILIITVTASIPTADWGIADGFDLYYDGASILYRDGAALSNLTETPITIDQSFTSYITVDDTDDVSFGIYKSTLDAWANYQSATVITLKRNTIRTYVDTIKVAGWGMGMGNAEIDTITAGSFGGIKMSDNYTILEVAAYTNTGTVTFNVEERGQTTPNTTGTDVMTSDLVADNNQQETSTFSNSAIAKDNWLVLTIVSITGDPTIFNVTVRGVKTD